MARVSSDRRDTCDRARTAFRAGTRLVRLIVSPVLLAACSAIDSPPTGTDTTQTPGVVPPTNNGPHADYSVGFSTNETGEATVVLTAANPNSLDVNDRLTINTTSVVWAFTYAQYSANFYAMDAGNAQLFLNHQTFQAYRLGTVGESGMSFVTLPAGTYYIGVTAGQTVTQGYSNKTFHEISVVTLPSWHGNGNVPLAASANPGGWQSRGFTWGSGDVRAYIETEGSGGKFAIMTNAQYQNFSTAYANGYTGGSYSYVYACGGQNGPPATEIECELKLTPGSYVLIYFNDTASPQGGAANIQFYAPN